MMGNLTDIPPGGVPEGDIGARPYSGGRSLREARERLGLSVVDVANRLKFAPRQIEALEADDFARLPEIAFVRGFVRGYAKLLQIDAVPLLAALPQPTVKISPAVESVAMAIPFPSVYAMRKLNIIWMAAGLLVAMVLGLFVWLHEGTPEVAQTTVETLTLPTIVEQPEPVSAVAEVVVAAKLPVVPTAPVAVAPQVRSKIAPTQEVINHKDALIHLVFDHDSWVELADKNGKSLLAQLNLRGTEQRVNGTPPFSLVIGNASGVRLYYQGKRIDLTPYNKAEVAHLTLE